MQEKSSSFLSNFFNYFSLLQKFTLISCIYGLAILVAISWMIKFQNDAIRATTLEIQGNHYERYVRSIYGNIALHRRELRDILFQNKKDRTDLMQSENQINEGFDKLINFDKQVENDLHTTTQDFQQREIRDLKPEELKEEWNQLVKNAPNLKYEENNRLHQTLIEELQSLVLYITESASLLQDPQIDNYYLIHTLYWLLTENLKTVPLINIEFEEYQNKKITNPQEAEEHLKKAREWLTVFRLHLNETKENIRKAIVYEKNFKNSRDIETMLQGPFAELLTAFEKYSQSIEASIANKTPLVSDTELVDNIRNVYSKNFAISEAISNTLEKILEERLNLLKKQQLISVGITVLAALLAFLLGILVMKSITNPLKKVMESAGKLGQGDLSVRVPVSYDDEVGKVGQAFNQMADSIQDLLKQLHWAGIQLTTSTTEIAATAKQQETTVIEQETTTKQIAATAKEISATTKDFAKTMKEISDTAEKTSALATIGKEGLEQMEITIRQMVDAATNIAAKLGILNEKAGTITSIVTTISKVADQTNLLSLNAAIEAEKAGEHGRSFAVIAREIRRLADQTANATLDIEKMINEMISAVSAGVMGVDKFSNEINSGVTQVSTAGEQLSKIIEQVQQLTSSFESVNEGMQAQFLGATQINESIVQLSETAQQTSISIRQFHKAIEQLNNAAQELQSMVTRIKK
jgi:methyl-accepting chemotaxis protein WspA